jgi:NAD+ synthetase
MRIALAQINPTVGDIPGNCQKMAQCIARAARQGAQLVVFSELAVTGYPPRDLLGRKGFVAAAVSAVEDLSRQCTGIAALVGYVRPNDRLPGRPLQNAAALLAGGRVAGVHVKTLLPTYDVFDETRYFEPGPAPAPMDLAGVRLGVSICEDLWDRPALGRPLYQEDPLAQLAGAGAGVIINMSASPFQLGKLATRQELVRRQALRTHLPIVYVNQVGGNDELIFDGSSMVVAGDGRVLGRAKSFEEDLLIVDLGSTGVPHVTAENTTETAALPDMEQLSRALQLGLADYCRKCGFKSVVLGLSGGIDSALVATLAADALGPQNVLALAMPSRFSSKHSLADAKALAGNLGIGLKVLPIESIHKAYQELLGPNMPEYGRSIADENVQARIRGNLIMAYSNACGQLALATGNKSELATGYCTLYGDMSGGLAVIGDVPKTLVYKLSRHLNQARGPRIPENTFTKPPSAELRPNQTDQDSLPPYDLLDAILHRYIELEMDADEIVAEGFDPAVVKRVLRLVTTAEYKRRQAAPVLKVTGKAFGTGRRMPIARRNWLG